MYRIVPGKHPWTLAAQVPKIEVKWSTIPAQGPTPGTKLAARRYMYQIDCASSFHPCFVEASLTLEKPVLCYKRTDL